ncbi:MAG: hypothetical protein A3F11_01925 [Gammaproteobacteria bacterium RIFCSPHIGHO2_12_FULL_37_14]|nr:MAG: hypothetical protein A3F11_01925 [Gammaproteobacteria bacterium RIFCSPHIGHO2_12_FULL_37_14]
MGYQSFFANPMKLIHDELLFFIHWKNEFIAAGCNSALIAKVLKTNRIEHYQQLFRIFTRLPPDIRKGMLYQWELFCLSGEKQSFYYAKQFCGLTQTKRNLLGMNALHYAALSGNPEQIYRALELGIIWNSKSFNQCNILHFAILSGELKQIIKVLELEDTQHVKLSRTIEKNRNVFHLAAFTGIIELINFTKDLINNIHEKDDDGLNALDYARASNEINAIEHLAMMGLSSDHCLDNFCFGGIAIQPPSDRFRSLS